MDSVPHASPPGNSPSGILSPPPGGNVPLSSPGLDGPSGLPSPLIAPQGGSGVGVGISPGATSEAVEVPGNKGHQRRGSDRFGFLDYFYPDQIN